MCMYVCMYEYDVSVEQLQLDSMTITSQLFDGVEVSIHACMRMYMYVSMRIYMYVCMNVNAFMQTLTHKHTLFPA